MKKKEKPNQVKPEQKLNRNGNKRGMHPNSRNNLRADANLNGRPRKEFSITSIQKEMMGQPCPYAKDPTWTWAVALAEAGMKDALTDERARENLKDRFEGKITQPVANEGTIVLHVKYDDSE